MGVSIGHGPARALLGSLTPLLWLALPPLSTGCGEPSDTSGTWGGSVVDSAGVMFVTNPSTGLWDSGEAWTVEEELTIGAPDGDPELEFGQITGVDVDEGGVIYVADLLAREVRVFAPDGSYIRTISSPGSGPEELGSAIAGPFLNGDVQVADLQNQRVSRFSREGEFLGSFHLDFTRGIPMRWDEAPGGTLVAQLRRIDPTGASSVPTGDVVVSFTAEGVMGDTLLALTPGESLQVGGGSIQMRVFGTEPIWDMGDDGRLVSGRNDEYRIEIRGLDGGLRQVVSLPFERRAVTDRDQQVILDAVSEAAERQGVPPEAMRMLSELLTFGDEYPAFASLLAGPHGSLWVQRLRTGTDLVGDEATFDVQDLGSNEWEVFDAEGRYLGVVEFPDHFQPLRVLGDRFYGITRDELDVQSLTVYRLVR
jgi:hypothetical protein